MQRHVCRTWMTQHERELLKVLQQQHMAFGCTQILAFLQSHGIRQIQIMQPNRKQPHG